MTTDRSHPPGTALPERISEAIAEYGDAMYVGSLSEAETADMRLRQAILTALHPAAPTIDQDFIAKVLAAYHDDSDTDIFTSTMQRLVNEYEHAQVRAEDGS